MNLKYDLKNLKEKILPRIEAEESNFPNSVLIDTISYCNFRCRMCPHSTMKRKQRIMEWNLYKKIINEIAEKKSDTRVWITFFGEGLILKDLHEKIAYAKDKGLTDVVFNTNGSMLDYSKCINLVKSGLDSMYVGIDAYKPETYKKVRVGGDLEKVIRGVLDYKRALEEYGNINQKIFVQFVVMDENKDEVDDFISFWVSHGIEVKIRPMISWGGKIETSTLKDDIERLPCYWGMNTISIADDGKVCMCGDDVECEYPMGDINNQTIEDVWNTTLKEFRLKHRKSDWSSLPELCRNCNDWQSGYAEYVNIEE